MMISFGKSRLKVNLIFLWTFCLWEGISIQTVSKPPNDGTKYLIVSTINLNVLKIKNNDTFYINTVSKIQF